MFNVFAVSRPRPLCGWLLSIGLLGFAIQARSAPVNDNFSTPLPLAGAVVTTGSNVDATVEATEPVHAGKPGGKSVWWAWTASHNSLVTISTVGSEFDTLLAIYTGSALASLTTIATNDDRSLTDITSQVTFMGVSGSTYRIAVAGLALDETEIDEGHIQLTVLDNDRFQDTTLLVGSSLTAHGHNLAATFESGEPNHAGQAPSHSVWWSWVAPANGAVKLRLSGTNTTTQDTSFYKRLAVYTGTAVNNLSLKASDGNTFVLTNDLDLDVTASTTYHIAADGVADGSGLLRLNLDFTAAPSNDRFANRITINGMNQTAMGSNVGASKEAGEPNHAGDAGGHSVWWTWTAPADGSLTLALSGEIQAKLLAVYSGNAVGNLTPLGENLSADPTNRVNIEVAAGAQYQIAVDGVGGQVGSIVLGLIFTMGGTNDQFADRITLVGSNLLVPGSNLGASAEAGEPNHGGYAPTHSVWWRWTAPANGTVMVTVFGDNLSQGGGPFYKLIGAYAGSAVSALTTNKLSSGLTVTNRINFDVVGGTAYQIAVDGHNDGQGQFNLSLVFTAAPPNDDFSAAIPLSSSAAHATGSNVAATKQPGEPNHAGPGGRSVWWSWTAPEAGNVTIATAGSTFNTLLAIYRGSIVSSLTLVASNNDLSGTNTSQVSYNAVAGTTYYIAVDGLLQESGNITLSISQLGAGHMIAPHVAANGTFQFSFIGQANSNYLIDASTNLLHWTTVATLINTTGSSFFVDTEAPNFPRRFYRARLP